jgi:hypothetical protein
VPALPKRADQCGRGPRAGFRRILRVSLGDESERKRSFGNVRQASDVRSSADGGVAGRHQQPPSCGTPPTGLRLNNRARSTKFITTMSRPITLLNKEGFSRKSCRRNVAGSVSNILSFLSEIMWLYQHLITTVQATLIVLAE